jgi:hypothetical protein
MPSEEDDTVQALVGEMSKGAGAKYFNYLLKSRCIRWRLVAGKADPGSKPKHKK